VIVRGVLAGVYPAAGVEWNGNSPDDVFAGGVFSAVQVVDGFGGGAGEYPPAGVEWNGNSPDDVFGGGV